MDSRRNLEIRLHHHWPSNSLQIMIVGEESEDGKKITTGDPVEVVMSEKNARQGYIEPTFQLPMYLAESLYQSLATFMEDRGIRSEQSTLMKGKIEAMQAHIKDLRAMLGLDRKLARTLTVNCNE